jgi:3'-phosphoadenosine 5'-phosphosulfate sulfotransferase (PAPS reductase)/FAD synthetase
MIRQLPLFPTDVPDPPRNALALLWNGAALALSVSGGKDSDAMCHQLLDLRQSEGWSGDVLMVHADLGARVEWRQTPDYVRDLARRKGVPLHVVRWTHGDLINRIWQRYHKDPSRPCWPSAKVRYCTADLKRGPISREIRRLFPPGSVICAMGLRAQESHARAKRQTFALHRQQRPDKGALCLRLVADPRLTEADVWTASASMATSRIPPTAGTS